MKSIIVTGSSKGLGKELALEFSKNYRVIVNGRDLEKLLEVYNLIPKDKRDMVVGDITKEKTLDILEDLAKERDLDILINNAGIYSGDLRRVMDVNFFAPVDLTKRILPIFLAKKSGLIVNINSIAGKRGSKGECNYSASKHALRGYFDCLRYDIISKGVRILDIYLGAMKNQMTKGRNQKLLINPKEAAKIIVKNCELYDSLSVNEINIGRIKYG